MWDTKYKNLQNEILAVNDRTESMHETAKCFGDYSKKDLKKKIKDIYDNLDADKQNYGIADATRIELENSYNSTTLNLINSTIKDNLETIDLTETTTEIFKNKTDKTTAMFLVKMNFIYDGHVREYLLEIVQRKRDVKELLRTFAEFYTDGEIDSMNMFAKLNNLMTGLKTV